MCGIKTVSLFSGGGGLDIGFGQAGYDIVWAIDNNADAVRNYCHNINNRIVCADINQIDIGEIPPCDVIIGGPPCQSFSLAGNRKCDDARGRLVWRYLEIIGRLQPRAFLFENVTGLLSAKDAQGNKILTQLLQAFRDVGYENISWQVVNAADYGVPQLRRRVIIVGLKSRYEFLFPATTHNADGTAGKQRYVSVEQALGDLPDAGRDAEVTEHDYPVMSELDRFIVSHVRPGGNYMDIPPTVNSVRIRRLQRDGGHTTCYGRMAPDKPSYTINTYFNRPNVGCNIHYKYDRLITVREALRLQTFPDSYTFVPMSKKSKNLIVGNAVPPLLARVLAENLKPYLSI